MYSYQNERQELFTDDGWRMFLRVRDFANKALAQSGAVRMQELIVAAGCGSTWTMMACVDRLVELGEIREVTESDSIPAQHRVFVAANGG